jgi:hypothetical protein
VQESVAVCECVKVADVDSDAVIDTELVSEMLRLGEAVADPEEVVLPDSELLLLGVGVFEPVIVCEGVSDIEEDSVRLEVSVGVALGEAV